MSHFPIQLAKQHAPAGLNVVVERQVEAPIPRVAFVRRRVSRRPMELPLPAAAQIDDLGGLRNGSDRRNGFPRIDPPDGLD